MQVLEVAAVGDESLDCDTPTDLERARRLLPHVDGRGSA
jgi:CTP:molybdopterin cytidylyltransferase MocA